MQLSTGGQALNRLYVHAAALCCQRVASEDWRSTYQYCASTTSGLVAGDLGAAQLQMVAQQLREGRDHWQGDLNRLGVDLKRHTAKR